MFRLLFLTIVLIVCIDFLCFELKFVHIATLIMNLFYLTFCRGGQAEIRGGTELCVFISHACNMSLGLDMSTCDFLHHFGPD